MVKVCQRALRLPFICNQIRHSNTGRSQLVEAARILRLKEGRFDG